MAIYRGYASAYSALLSQRYGRRIARALPTILDSFNCRPSRLLDIGCGDGAFAVEASDQGHHVVGIDSSSEMLAIARSRARERSHVSFVRADWMALPIACQFDLVTCWFDSWNYVLVVDDLCRVFECASAVLAPDGILLFDLNSISRMSSWNNIYYLENEKHFVLYDETYDPSSRTATFRVVGFSKRGRAYDRVDELHVQHAYTISEIEAVLSEAGLQLVRAFGLSFDGENANTEVATDSTPRIYFCARRKQDP
jgi:SAM-dependent methyltransferase